MLKRTRSLQMLLMKTPINVCFFLDYVDTPAPGFTLWFSPISLQVVRITTKHTFFHLFLYAMVIMSDTFFMLNIIEVSLKLLSGFQEYLTIAVNDVTGQACRTTCCTSVQVQLRSFTILDNLHLGNSCLAVQVLILMTQLQ